MSKEELLTKLHNLIPDGEGSISMHLWADGTHKFIFEFGGTFVADCYPPGEFEILGDTCPINWRTEVQNIIDTLNQAINEQ